MAYRKQLSKSGIVKNSFGKVALWEVVLQDVIPKAFSDLTTDYNKNKKNILAAFKYADVNEKSYKNFKYIVL